MKTTYKMLKLPVVFVLGLLLFASCEDYLDKSPELSITEADVFTKFSTFQGYVENIYQNVPQIDMGTAGGGDFNWNYGDDVIMTGSNSLCTHFDAGNNRQWTSVGWSPYAGNISQQIGNAESKKDQGYKGWWHNGWLGIRLCNVALSHLEDLQVAASDQLLTEQRDLLEGQSRFFRGFFHFHILRSFGGIAYIDTVFAPSDKIRLPRLSYYETAMKVAEDLEKAAELLPVNWDLLESGQTTIGSNEGRITKQAAYGYLGKNLLYAASPLMNGVSTGDYSYNTELCKDAADAFLKVIKIANENPAIVGLETWADYYKNFYTLKATTTTVLGKEIVYTAPLYWSNKRWRYGEFTMTYLGGWGVYASPTENYVENFGMANGLSIREADSGYDPMNRWVNRDPRFEYNILHDGERLGVKENVDSWAQLYNGGRHRNTSNSLTGYGHSKFKDITCNSYDNGWAQYSYEVPLLRLADIYLMYAEAVNEAYGGPTGSAPGGITALQAVNIVRNRATLPNVDARYSASKETFREFLREERAVELAFENHRWYDLRRWHVAHLLKYREKYSLDFDKEHTQFNKTLYLTRVFDEKHYWLPFPTDQVTLYPEFTQNPGW